MKPEPAIYKTALAALGGIDPLETLFIDDLEPNILGAVPARLANDSSPSRSGPARGLGQL